jgi:hypothetical protein
VWALVSRGEANAFTADWDREYRRGFDHPAATFLRTGAGPPLKRIEV